MPDWVQQDGGQIWESQGVVEASNTAVNVTANATANAKGLTPVLIHTAVRPYSGFLLQILRNQSLGRYLIDLSWDSAAANIFVANISVQSSIASALGMALYIPMEVPNGATIYARSQSSVASSLPMALAITGMSGGSGYTRCQTIGVQTNPTGGTSVIATGGAEGDWTPLAPVTAQPVQAVILLMGNQATTTESAAQRTFWDIGIGAIGSERAILSNIVQAANVTSDMMLPQYLGPIPLHIPAGATISARAAARVVNLNTDIAILAFS
jgi:hypothetical protein